MFGWDKRNGPHLDGPRLLSDSLILKNFFSTKEKRIIFDRNSSSNFVHVLEFYIPFYWDNLTDFYMILSIYPFAYTFRYYAEPTPHPQKKFLFKEIQFPQPNRNLAKDDRRFQKQKKIPKKIRISKTQLILIQRKEFCVKTLKITVRLFRDFSLQLLTRY